jgi:polysaccharide transporter, PST family
MITPPKMDPLKRTLRNAGLIVAASSLQRLMPFFTFPILSRRIGPDAFGQYMSAIALSAVVTQIVEFGFNISATNKVAENDPNNNTKMSKILGEVVGGRLFISLVVIIVLAVVRQFHSIFVVDDWLFWSSVGLGIVIGSDFRFMFYGKQSVGYLTIYAVVYTVLSSLVIFVAVQKPDSLWIAFSVPAIIALSFIFISIYLIKPNLRAACPTAASALIGLRESWPSFLQRGLVQIGSNMNLLILGFFVPSTIIGYFGMAERLLRQAAFFVLNPAQSTMLPHVASLRASRPQQAAREFLMICSVLFVASLVGGAIVYAIAPLIAWFFLGVSSPEAYLPLRILCLSPSLLVMNQFGFSLWLFFARRQTANNIISLGFVFTTAVFVMIASAQWGLLGACWAIILSQTLFALIYAAYCYSVRIAPWQVANGIPDFPTPKSVPHETE